ncbi:MFS transporter [Nocardioides sp. GCM10027113]|uniref:MFS transporter n=1 Tax=unclassified Nocardioides TaxID=2615069 RepID=UPI00360F53C7
MTQGAVGQSEIRPPAKVPERLTRRGVPVDPTLRVLALGTFVNRAGTGAAVTTFALFFTQEVGLAAAEVGLVLSVAALVAMAGQVPLGHLGDTRGPRETMRALTLAAGVVLLGLLVARSFWAVLAVMSLATLLMVGNGAVRNGYIARIATGGRGVQFKAYLRAVTNVAMSLGAALGGLALLIDATWAYLAVFAVDGVATIATGFICSRLPHLPPSPARAAGEPRLAVLRDRPFVAVTVLNGLVAMHFVVMELGIPLWIAAHTEAPKSMVAVLLVLNTVAVAAFQVRLTRGVDDVPASARAMVVGCAWIAAGFVIVSFSAGTTAAVAVVMLLLGATVHVVGEMISSGGQWGISMGLAPDARQGQYQGFAGLGFSLSNVVAPTLIALLCIEWGRPGWWVMAALVLGAGLLQVPVCRWALRTR